MLVDTITPHFDTEGAHHLSIQQTLSNPSCAADEPLFIFETKYGNVPAHPFTENIIKAYDEAGPLQIYFTPKSNSPDQEWRVDRNTSGDVTLQFTVHPRKVDITTPMGPRVDMRRDQGGLCAVGRWFLPRAAVEREYHNIVELESRTGPGRNARRVVREDASYRVFIRKVIRGFGGGSCLESYMLEYDGMGWKETDEDLVALFSHEMIHSFSLMNPEADGYDNGWYIEGIAEFYSIFLPYRFGLRGLEYLHNRLNAVLLEYGTSPRIEMDAIDAQHEFYNDWYAERIPYVRGCVYLLQIDSRLRKMTGRFGIDQNSPLDDIIVDMGKRWHRGEQVLARDWLEYLRPLLGEDMDVSEDFQSMLRVAGVVPGSRAALAGLKDEDHIVATSRVSLCYSSLSAYYELVIERAGEFTTDLLLAALIYQG
ncbi:hypothetical protein G4B84_004736 [Aspergillus flavus NRRL3357]|nr:uncharacterized protein G4B84_004736 [Aspergillus flavus NRRL3357]QMW29401.1 hypothetical protein G4B84_004736 [Aspergillus flavus NRRL3357]